MKTCKKCGKEKEATTKFFTKDKAHKDGFRGTCNACKREYAEQYRKANPDKVKDGNKAWYKANFVKAKATSKAFYQANPEKCSIRDKAWREANSEKCRVNRKLWQHINPDKVSASCKKWNKAHPDKVKILGKTWAEANPEKCRQNLQRRKARKLNLPSTFTLEQWETTTNHFNNRCAYCGKEKSLAQEHFLALSRGGEYALTNIIPSCQSCNSSKGTRSFSIWYPQQSFYSKKREKTILSYLGYKNNVQQLALM